MQKLNNKTIFISGLIILTLIYSLYNIYLVDVSYYESIPRKIRHINRFAVIMIVYGIGTFAIRKFAAKWMIQLWQVIYINLTLILLIIGFYDWATGVASEGVRNIANTLNEFLISPILYVGIGIFNSRYFRIS